MVTLRVVDETGSHEELAAKIDSILARAVRLVEPATGLALPDTVTFRIVPVETYRSAQVANMALNLRKYRKVVPAWRRPFVALASRFLLRILRGRTAKQGKYLVMGSTFSVPETGHSETLFVPEALQHNGILTAEKFLTALTVHEMLHQAQNAASEHRANWIANRAMTLLDPGGIRVLEEGHATWGDQAITQTLYGTAVDIRSAPKSEEYKSLHQGGVQAKLAVYEGGRLLVNSAIDAIGLQEFNKVWADDQRLPRKEEVAEAFAAFTADEPASPTIWATRLAQTTSAAAGSRNATN
ncbi:hypothetical protein [Streptomyces anthocyanicus]|uniref:hypothetical protein n=1 Tax=Streptomyces anthocyanicus TaxID=68174 RepID=UPI003807EC49